VDGFVNKVSPVEFAAANSDHQTDQHPVRIR
jgi:hypothetical protein